VRVGDSGSVGVETCSCVFGVIPGLCFFLNGFRKCVFFNGFRECVNLDGFRVWFECILLVCMLQMGMVCALSGIRWPNYLIYTGVWYASPRFFQCYLYFADIQNSDDKLVTLNFPQAMLSPCYISTLVKLVNDAHI